MGQVDEAAQIAEVIVRVAATYPDIFTAKYAQEAVDAAMGIVEVLHTDVDPVAWRKFIKAITAQADADPDGTIGSVAGAVAAVEGAQLISALVASS